MSGLQETIVEGQRRRMVAWLHLLCNGALRREHQAWLQWLLFVRAERKREQQEAHDAALQHTRVMQWCKAMLEHRGLALQLMAWRTWHAVVMAEREAQLREAHAKEIAEAEMREKADKMHGASRPPHPTRRLRERDRAVAS